jgi:hypothetical protein
LDSPELRSVSGQKDSSNKLASWFVTGFTDAEGCSFAFALRQSKAKVGIYIFIKILNIKPIDLPFAFALPFAFCVA